jgi:c-di-GMP-binding flagellar brake protein YcgR
MQTSWCEFDEVLHLDNRRRADRVAGEVAAQYCTESGATGSARTINLSSTGARMVVQDEGLKEGEFTLQLGSVQVLARQVWETPLLRGRSRVVGVHFSSISPTQRLALQRLLGDLQRAS